MNKQELEYLFIDQATNYITITKNRSASALYPSVRELFENLYKKYINDAVNFDWNCSGCIIDNLTRLYAYSLPLAIEAGVWQEDANAATIDSPYGIIETTEVESEAPAKKANKKK